MAERIAYELRLSEFKAACVWRLKGGILLDGPNRNQSRRPSTRLRTY
jgi:hypothetical protein